MTPARNIHADADSSAGSAGAIPRGEGRKGGAAPLREFARGEGRKGGAAPLRVKAPLRVFAAIPAKDFVDAKHRLAGLLTATERAALARAMLEDVLAAVCAVPLQAVWVVTRDPEVIACANCFPVEVLTEEANRGHSEAVALAQAAAVARGAEAFLTVPGDVPDATADELRAVLGAVRGERAAVFVPSVSGYGTNGALLRPPDAMTLKFGEPSFANHLTAARGRHLETTVLRVPGLGLDIDTPDDLRALLDRDAPTRTGRLAARLGLRERLARPS